MSRFSFRLVFDTAVLSGLRRGLPVAILAAAALLSASPSTAADLADLAWLAGHWRGVDGETVSEEAWLGPSGGVMLGVHRDVTASGPAFFEYLRIEEREDGLVYVAQPMGRPPTEFPATTIQGQSVTFEKPDHDFPRVIIYHRQEDTLHVRAEGERDGGPLILTWRWELQP